MSVSTPPSAALALQNVSCRVLTDVSLTVNPGELVAVTGPSGSGKSTLIHVAGLLLPVTAGTVLVDGIDVSRLTRTQAAEVRRRRIGLVLQRDNLLPRLTLAENIALPLELDNAPVAGIGEALAAVGLEGKGDLLPEAVSEAEAQRAALARALIGPRTLVLADEPTGALDTTAGAQVLGVLRRLIDTGGSGLLVTHEPRVADWADRTVSLRDGRLT
ncbi:ATP-binding cassette domain-containing protein [Corynebacterium sp. YIM 101645]|uniref:ATP-binding cassette domain-containing protein n=1 Tax=Corynebacterium lemuris TaxID=1859292 RepID=A0ABT2G0C1_9CORY|nr:ATP-binding cassette domain-containing protein [Corynebacterium lemuris]MCS5480440.1 ATP-binding cassette domain-containing protein [Corynebacterium lemuris]